MHAEDNEVYKVLESIKRIGGLPDFIQRSISQLLEDKNNEDRKRDLVFYFFYFDIVNCTVKSKEGAFFIQTAIPLLEELLNSEFVTAHQKSIYYLYLFFGYNEIGKHSKGAIYGNKLVAIHKEHKILLNENLTWWLNNVLEAFASYTKKNLEKADLLFPYLNLFYPLKSNNPNLYNSMEELHYYVENRIYNKPKPVPKIESLKITTQNKSNKHRVLILGRSYFNTGSSKRPHEVINFIKVTLNNIGVQNLHLDYSDALSRANESNISKTIQSLASNVLKLMPHLIIFDNFMVQINNTGHTEFANLILKLRDKNKFKLIGLYLDSWIPEQENAISQYGHLLDLIWDPTQPVRTKSPATHHYIKSPMPFDRALYRTREKSKQALFMGTVERYNLHRALYIYKLKKSDVKVDIIISNDANLKTVKNDAEYASFLCKFRVNINFSTRNDLKKITTGRVWESLLAETVLLEEDNEHTRFYLTPFFHYIPYTSFYELEIALKYLESNTINGQIIANNGFNLASSYFHPDIIWGNVFNEAKINIL